MSGQALKYSTLTDEEKQAYLALSNRAGESRFMGDAERVDYHAEKAQDPVRNFMTGGLNGILHGAKALYHMARCEGWFGLTHTPTVDMQLTGMFDSLCKKYNCTHVAFDQFPNCPEAVSKWYAARKEWEVQQK